jgi:hypothetical protein
MKLHGEVSVGPRGTGRASSSGARHSGNDAWPNSRRSVKSCRRHQTIREQGQWLGRAARHAAPHQSPMAYGTPATEPTPAYGVGTRGAARRSLPAAAEHPPPVAGTEVPRQVLKVGAGCLNWARPDLSEKRRTTCQRTGPQPSFCLLPSECLGWIPPLYWQTATAV